ncbi:HNH endonuclease [Pigmentiphaga daeguensis]|uniref:HNH endonuclease signature motif containing protein n=1 Tax=Pigmentiphaga daeguensis TaxID=414049 RepID=A0ABP3L6P8_9BURK
MARRPKYPCRHRGCPALVDGPGYCPAHASDAGWRSDQLRGNRHQRGYGTDWDRTRKRILARDGYLCQCEECQAEGRPLLATEVDHRIPKARGGTDDESNLRAINRDCHKRKTQRESRDARRRSLHR